MKLKLAKPKWNLRSFTDTSSAIVKNENRDSFKTRVIALSNNLHCFINVIVKSTENILLIIIIIIIMGNIPEIETKNEFK